MSLENWLYAQVVMIRRRQLDDKKGKYKTEKYNFQGQSARTKRWFGLDHDYLNENLMTGETYFYKTLSN